MGSRALRFADFEVIPNEVAPPPDAPAALAPLAVKQATAKARPAPKPSRRPPRCNDPARLVPAFWSNVEAMIADLAAEGWDPLLWETIRTPERGAWLMRGGASRNGARSMHIFGVAVDVVCGAHLWSCGDHGCGYYAAQGKAAKRAGLHWGGLWRRPVDRPHVQAVTVRQQNLIRASSDVAATLAELQKKKDRNAATARRSG